MRILILLLFLCVSAFAAKEDFAQVQKFIAAMKNGDHIQLAELVRYPLHMPYPVPDIKDEKDFIDKYDLLFDEALEKFIINSNADDWATVGWRGIMLGRGTLWFDEEGYLRSSNYTTQAEVILREALIAKEKASIYSSLNEYYRTKLVMATESFTIRIDELNDHTLRYASWKKGKPMSSKPSLILRNGKYDVQGSLGVTTYTFTNGKYTYVCGDDLSLPSGSSLTVYNDGEEILYQEATFVDW